MIKFIKKYWKEFLIIIGFGFMLLYFFNPKIEEIEVPIKIEVPVPVIENQFDTIKDPYPVYIKETKIDSLYYNKYTSLKSKQEKDSLFKESIKLNEYNVKFENDTVIINVFSKVRGKLLEQTSKIKTKPYTIPLDTVLKIKVPTKAKLFYGGGVRIPLNNPFNILPNPYGGIYLKTKSDNIISLELDSQNISVGYAWKF